MRRMHLAVMITFLLVLTAGIGTRAWAQAVFSWTDDAGTVHFTDDPSLVPEAHRATATESGRRESARTTEEPRETRAPRGASPGSGSEGAGDAEGRERDESSPAPLQEAVAETGADVDNFGHDKRYWQDRKRFWEQRLEVSQRLLEETRREFNLTNQRFDRREYKKMKALRERMAELEEDVAQAQAMLDGGLARDARRSGAQPGWIR